MYVYSNSLCGGILNYEFEFTIRPTTQGGRPLSGFVRPGTQGGRPGTMEGALRTPRTAHTARPVTSASGRYVRLGTVSISSLIWSYFLFE